MTTRSLEVANQGRFRAKGLARAAIRVYTAAVSTTALHIIQLVKSLPPADQQAVWAALSAQSAPVPGKGAPGSAAFAPADYEGLSDDDPFFEVMVEIEQQRHAYPGRPAPAFD